MPAKPVAKVETTIRRYDADDNLLSTERTESIIEREPPTEEPNLGFYL